MSEPLDTITADDIHRLCADQVSEDAEFELKSDLPHKDGFGKDAWHSGGGIGDRARNEIADEIVAFANTTGGVLCLGINETADHPKRADSVRALPRVHELARRLRQAIYSVIEPPLPVLEAIGVSTQADGGGVVLLRVPPSRRRPHRQLLNKEVFVRRADETARLSMREVQELTIQAVSDATRVEAAIKDRRERFREELTDWVHKNRAGGEALQGAGLHLLAIPTTPLDLGRVAGRPRLIDLAAITHAHFGPNNFECAWPSRTNAWKPGLRSITNADTGRRLMHSLTTNGECEVSLKLMRQDIAAGWLLGGLGTLLAWLGRVREEAEANVEYAVAVQLPIIGQPSTLIRYGNSAFFQGFDAFLPVGNNEFPLMSVGPADEFPRHLQRFDEDLWNLAGYDPQGQTVTFTITRPPGAR